jgi:hypothetical protein
VKARWVNRWLGCTVYCLASGPSLNRTDCELVRSTGHPVIVTNNTWQMCPWADVLLACDAKWWREYGAAARAAVLGDCLSYDPNKEVPFLARERWFEHFHNTGADAISLAVETGASKVILLGYDCQMVGDRKHWHDEHPAALKSPIGMNQWHGMFAKVAKMAAKRGTRVINCSRETALTCFERGPLEEFLHP